VDGIRFDSRKEAGRWVELRALEAAGAIAAIRRQVRIPIIVNGVRVCAYVADFVYVERGRWVVEDTKGFRTAIYKLKRKLLKAACGIEIRET
jgi:hypothetical protein